MPAFGKTIPRIAAATLFATERAGAMSRVCSPASATAAASPIVAVNKRWTLVRHNDSRHLPAVWDCEFNGSASLSVVADTR